MLGSRVVAHSSEQAILGWPLVYLGALVLVLCQAKNGEPPSRLGANNGRKRGKDSNHPLGLRSLTRTESEYGLSKVKEAGAIAGDYKFTPVINSVVKKITKGNEGESTTDLHNRDSSIRDEDLLSEGSSSQKAMRL